MFKEHGYDESYAKYCDHTCLRAYTTPQKIVEFCDEAKKFGAYAVCVNPIHVALVAKELAGTNVKVAAVIGFPLGANKTCIKAMEAAEAVKDGANEVDMVINIGYLRAGDYEFVYNDIKAVVDAVQGKAGVKVIIETCYLNDVEKIAACVISEKAGASFVKTSTGMGSGGATLKDIQLMQRTVHYPVKVKASGGVDNREAAYKFLQAGCDRLGVSRVPQIVNDDTSIMSAAATNKPPKYD